MTTSETAFAPLSLSLFGPMQVRVRNRLLPRLRSRKSLWLLALLTLRHDRPVEREWLAGSLWPDMDQSKAFDNLRPILSELRRALGDQAERIKSPDRHTLYLDLTGAEADVLAFDAAIASDKIPALEKAVDLYRGPLLEGCPEEWVFQERAHREHSCMQALQKLGDSAMAAGDFEKAIAYYQRAVRMDPLWETARRGWMEALAKSGDRNAALQVYREFIEVLKDDPRALPDEQTTALYVRLRAEAKEKPVLAVVETKTRPAVAGYLPHPLTDLVGREDEQVEVASRLRRSRLVTLTGLGGIGKTRLALEVASEVVAEYADGVWLVALDSLSEGKHVASRIVSVLGLKEESGRAPLQTATEHLRAKRALIVLDNCEHLLEACAQAATHLLQECPGVRILATSREALGLTGEATWAVPALATPDPRHLPSGKTTLQRVLMGYESVQLFVERAQSVHKTFSVTPDQARAVAEICRGLEGIPLAIELAAARTKAMTIEQIASHLNDHLGFLTGGSRTALARQQTLRATLDWSYALLSEPERLLLRRLSVFAGGWSLEAAEIVCSDSGADVSSTGRGEPASRRPDRLHLKTTVVLDLLTSLVDKSLVVFEERTPDEEGRYRLLEMVRQYAAESMQAAGETDRIKARHRSWLVKLAEEANANWTTDEHGKWQRRLETEYANFRATLAWDGADAFEPESDLQLWGAMWRFWEDRGEVADARRGIAAALERTDANGTTSMRARALNAAGVLAYRQGDYMAARTFHQESLDFRRQQGNMQAVGASLNNLGNVALHLGEYAEARALFGESLANCRERGDNEGMAYAIENLGSVTFMLGDYEAARSHYSESLRLRGEAGNEYGAALSLGNLGSVSVAVGDFHAAEAQFEECLKLFRKLDVHFGIAMTICNLGIVAHYRSDFEAAETLLEEACGLFREMGEAYGTGLALHSAGNLACTRGDLAGAQARQQEGLRLRKAIGEKQGIADSLGGQANVLSAKGDGRGAVYLWAAAHALRETIGGRMLPIEVEAYERRLEQARSMLGEEYEAAWEQGISGSWEQAVDFALGIVPFLPVHPELSC